MSAKDFFGDAKVTECPITTPVVVTPDTSLAEAVERMRQRNRGYAMICEGGLGGKLLGLFTERDFLYKVVGKGMPGSTPMRQLMRPQPIVLTKNTTLSEAIELMDRHKYRRIPLVDQQGNALGMITVFDIIHYLSEHFPAEVGNLPPRLDQRSLTPEGG